MTRYFSKPKTSKLWLDDMPETVDPVAIAPLTVHDIEAYETRLLDDDGNKIMRAANSIGFVRSK